MRTCVYCVAVQRTGRCVALRITIASGRIPHLTYPESEDGMAVPYPIGKCSRVGRIASASEGLDWRRTSKRCDWLCLAAATLV